ncbi:DNA-binding protein RFX5 isoform X2 [Rhinatrema bivittatum]|nr:DNA-binding protein RFX5 isoform X2 [Rhinatrema bivittatum]XP_029437005.1 DNA-binding protein RFX5 isoform X2 [Rhinatrema bivittatum]
MDQEESYSKIPQKEGEAAESDILLQKLRNTISKPVQNKVHGILEDVLKFSDNDKLYLYLQLPSGPSTADKSSLDLNSLSTAEHMHACTWIRNHLEDHIDTCLPKQDVYDAYNRYCDNLCCRPLSAANFGKIIREIFPNIKARRLGGRGQSKYCYSGIRRKALVSMPPLPSLDHKVTENSELVDLVQVHNNEVMDAACTLICHWAEKILKRSFNNVVEVAHFLLQQQFINPRDASAELIMSVKVSESRRKGPKRQPASSKCDEPESTEGAAEQPAQIKKESASKPTSSQPAKQRKNAKAQKSHSSSQVTALVARLHPILPRVAPWGNLVSCSPPICYSSIITSEAGTSSPAGHVKVTSLPLPSRAASAVHLARANGSRLVSQQAAVPHVNMILPNIPAGFSFPIPDLQAPPREGDGDVTSSEAATCSGQDLPKSSGGNRLSDSASAVATRKRGRPRKVPPKTQLAALDSASLPGSAGKSNGTPKWQPPDQQFEIMEVTIGEEFLPRTEGSPEMGTDLGSLPPGSSQDCPAVPSAALATNRVKRVRTEDSSEKMLPRQGSLERAVQGTGRLVIDEVDLEACQKPRSSLPPKEEGSANQAHAKGTAVLTSHLNRPKQGISQVSVIQRSWHNGKERPKDVAK